MKELDMANACVVTCLGLADRYAIEGAAFLMKLDSELKSRVGRGHE